MVPARLGAVGLVLLLALTGPVPIPSGPHLAHDAPRGPLAWTGDGPLSSGTGSPDGTPPIVSAAVDPRPVGGGPGALTLPFLPALPISPSSPVPEAVNPTATYSKEPAPMGLTDFGLGAGGTPYTYTSNRFLGTASIRSLASSASGGYGGGYVSFQLNVVLRLTSGASTAAYWIQDVPLFDDSSGSIYFEDNVWNMSGSSSSMHTTSISGNGSVYSSGSGNYYADGASSSLPGSGVTLSTPANVSAEVVSSTSSGVPHVAFEYNDGYGWVTYDNVSFSWASGWTDHGFTVNGSAYNPRGLYYDAEWVVCGPGGGSSAAVSASNMTFGLDEYNGGNFESVPAAYAHGGDTAETVSGVSVALPSASAVGFPIAVLTAGSGTFGALFTRSNVEVVNATSPVGSATIAGVSPVVPFTGPRANFTVLVGVYLFELWSGGRLSAEENVSASAGGYLAFEFLTVETSPTPVYPGGAVTARGASYPSGSTVQVTWTSNGTELCHTTANSSGGFQCQADIPAIPSATYGLRATSTGAKGSAAFGGATVGTTLTIGLVASRTRVDVLEPVVLTANATGGVRPYSGLNWSFGDGTLGSGSQPTANHSYGSVGAYTVRLEVTDAVGSTANATLSVSVLSDPTVGAPFANRTGADVGQSVAFGLSVSNGSGAYQFAWSGLPPGCVATVLPVECAALTAAGTFTPTVGVTDSDGMTVTATGASFVVAPDPTIGTPSASRANADTGQNVVFNVVYGPGGGADRFVWLGVPSGCVSGSAWLNCSWTTVGVAQVRAMLTDANGMVVTSPATAVNIGPSPAVGSIVADRLSSDVAQTTHFSIAPVGGTGALVYDWTGLPTGCASSGGPALDCTPTGAGVSSVEVTVTDANGATASATLPFTVSARPDRLPVTSPSPELDVGATLSISTGVSGGAGGVSYSWTGLPTGCSSNASTVACAPRSPGRFVVNVTATDANGVPATGPGIQIDVVPSPTVTGITTSPPSPLEGIGLTITAETSGGTPAFVYQWSGLPEGCTVSHGPTVACTPTSTGTSVVRVSLTDADGRTANGTFSVTVGAQFLGLPALDGYALLGSILVGVVVVAFVLRRRRVRPAPTSPP